MLRNLIFLSLNNSLNAFKILIVFETLQMMKYLVYDLFQRFESLIDVNYQLVEYYHLVNCLINVIQSLLELFVLLVLLFDVDLEVLSDAFDGLDCQRNAVFMNHFDSCDEH